MKKFLIIQTAFIGDVILATALLEKLHQYFPNAQIDFLLRKGNESLLNNHPFLNQIIIWDKKQGKLKNLFKILRQIRAEKYDYVINVQRFLAAGILTAFSKAKNKIGFDKNPLSFLFSKKIKHEFKKNWHEVNRNLLLIENLTDNQICRPQLYPSPKDYEEVKKFQNQDYICVAPTSVWFTKQFAFEKWVEFLKKVPTQYVVYLLGAPSDSNFCENLIQKSQNKNIFNLTGKLSLLASAALMEKSTMNYVNDSAPMHLSSSVNAPTCAVYCSTITDFGYFPLSEKSYVIESKEVLTCRPCGLHGKKDCPEKHFKCAFNIDVQEMLNLLD
jgi:heptosyltransferase-2